MISIFIFSARRIRSTIRSDDVPDPGGCCCCRRTTFCDFGRFGIKSGVSNGWRDFLLRGAVWRWGGARGPAVLMSPARSGLKSTPVTEQPRPLPLVGCSTCFHRTRQRSQFQFLKCD